MSATDKPCQPDPSTARLVNLIITLLAPMFLWSTNGDIPLARIAAAETVNEYRIHNRLSVIMVGKIIAFDLGTLTSLSQSMCENVSILLALRLRSNANSLDRSSDRNRRALEAAQPDAENIPDIGDLTEESLAASLACAEEAVRDAKARMQAGLVHDKTGPTPAATPAPEPVTAPISVPTPPEADSSASVTQAAPAPPAALPTAATVPTNSVLPVPAALPTPSAPPVFAVSIHSPAGQPPSAVANPAAASSTAQRQTAWADAMNVVAAEFKAGLNALPPAECAKEMLRIRALTQTATALASGTVPPPVPALNGWQPDGPTRPRRRT